jgi:ABC-type Fe3+-siderophore transport system permease subunit
MVALEALFLAALLSAFIGFVAFVALASPQASGSAQLRGALVGIVVAASVAAVGAFFLYAISPGETLPQTVSDAGA